MPCSHRRLGSLRPSISGGPIGQNETAPSVISEPRRWVARALYALALYHAPGRCGKKLEPEGLEPSRMGV